MKKILFHSVLAVFLFSQTVFASFSDVTEKTYYKNAIDWMADNGVINGYGDGTFGPDNCVKRVEFLKMLFEALGLDEKGYNSSYLFSDTDGGEWYADYVKAARFLGVINGYPDGTFRPAQCVNRVEAMKMAILQFNDGKIPSYGAMFGNPFDIASWDGVENEWWYDYYSYAFAANLVGTEHFKKYNADWSGMGVESSFANPTFNFAPNGTMTRMEVAEMLYRMKTVKDNEGNIEGYYYDEIKPKDVVIKFDGCGNHDKYKNNSWFVDLINKYSGDLSKEFVEGCLALDGSKFVFIADETDTNPTYTYIDCGKAFSYDVSTGVLETPNVIGYCISEFGKRIGKYIEFKSADVESDKSCETTHSGKYYFMENGLDYNVDTNCDYY